ncbi:MAG: hypothetical protein KA354_02730 [Phycisphaerae bacterium]|nr:hypothetical protein [Phycisphaerae bacterium]
MRRFSGRHGVWVAFTVLGAWAAAAPGQQITDSFTRADDTAIGATESPAPGISYVERATLGALGDAASIVGNELFLYGTEGSGASATGPGQAILEIDAPDIEIAATIRYAIDNPTQACANNSAGFILRKPTSDCAINNPTSAGQILIQMTPAGGLYISQKLPTAADFYQPFYDNPWVAGNQALGQLHQFMGAGALPAEINGRPFDADGDGVLESNEPFQMKVILRGTSLRVLINEEETASVSVQGTASSPHNYFAMWKNRFTGSASCAPSHAYFDDLQVLVDIVNDPCANATSIGEGIFNGMTVGATNDGVSSCGNAAGSPDVWYSYTSPVAGTLMINTCGSLLDTVLSVLDGCSGTELACNNDCEEAASCTAPASCMRLPVQANQQLLIRVAGANGQTGVFRLAVQDDLVVRHVGQNNPIDEGWSLGTNAAVYDVGKGTEGEDHWYMQVVAGRFLNYARALSAVDLQSPLGWTATWRAQVVESGDIWQAHMMVEDGSDIWVIHAVDGTGTLPAGAYIMRSDFSPVRVGDLDPRDGFHSYQIVYDPTSGTASYYLDGKVVAWQSRDDAPNATAGSRRIVVGDNSSGGPASNSRWSFGELTLGRSPAAPPNDECGGAAVLADGITYGSTLGASTGGSASCGDSNTSPDVWYAYTASCDGDLTLDTCGSPMDTVLAVYTGTCGSLAEAACNDQCPGLPCDGSASCVTLTASVGQTFLVRVAGAGGTKGVFRLQARCGIPLNDKCADAFAIGEGITEGSTFGATNDGTASCGNSSTAPDVWYKYTPPMDATLRIDTCGSALNTVLSVYDGCGGAELVCNDECEGTACQGPPSCLALSVQAGKTYLIRVAGADGVTGDFRLSIRDNVVLEHSGRKHPILDEGWTEAAAGGYSGGPGNEGMDYWAINANDRSRLAYRANEAGGQVAPVDFNDPAGWTLTATLRAIRSPDAFTTLLYVMDGKDLWGLHIIARDAVGERGVYRSPLGLTQFQPEDLLYDLDPADGYHTYQIIYDPAGDGGIGSVSYYVDGNQIGTDVRANVYDIALHQVQWGDDTTGGELFGTYGPSQSHYAFVRFEIGQHIHAGPPCAYDNCAQATPVSEGEWYGVTAGASTDGAASCGDANSSPDVWYTYTASCTGTLAFDTCGALLDTVVSVYSGCGGTELACDDNGCGSQSRALTTVSQGQTYLIRVAGNAGTAGPFRFHVACGTPPNDNCASAAAVGDGSTQGTTLGASADGTATCGGSDGSPDVWYTYTASCTAPLEINTCGSGFDTVVSVYGSCGGTELACGDNECDRQSRIEIDATQGTTYLIRVSGNNYAQGDFTLNVLCKAPPANDQCATAIAITEGTTTGSSLFATADGDALCGTLSTAGSPDVWYLYTASRSGRLKIDVSNADFAALVSLHQPANCPGSLDNQVACGTPILSQAVQQGGTYLIRVAGVNGASGSFNLELSFDKVVIKHEGQNNPLDEGWTRDSNNPNFAEGPGDDGTPHWLLAQLAGYRVNYQFTGLTASDFADPKGWTLSATVKAVTALTEWQVHIMLQDGQDTWCIHLIDGTSSVPQGVYATGPDFGLIKISDIDPTADYHLYQIIYNPVAQTASYTIDGTLVYTQTRDEAFDATYQRLVWGDNTSGNGPSHGKWAMVQFEFGSQASFCSDPFADTDRDGDVDMVDFGQWQLCFTGGPATIPQECTCFDLAEPLGTIDGADLAFFTNCWSGPSLPANKSCDD